MRKLLLVVFSLIVILVAISYMNRYQVFYSIGQFFMDCRIDDPAHYSFMGASDTKDPILKSKALTQVSRIAARKRRPDAGLGFALQAIEADPRNHDAWFMAAALMEDMGSMPEQSLKKIDMESMPERSLKYIDKAIELKPDQPNYYALKSVILAKSKKYEEVKEILQMIVEKYPDYEGFDEAKKRLEAINLLLSK